ncbi:MAG: T9SS type A sorting domain-containing protein [Chlorobi bacterium]|nr:T9SS type A sorting domain-containing protein [Chlorobiota bacterium]
MKKPRLLIFILTFGLVAFSINWAISDSSPSERERRAKVDYRIDNNGYWIKMAKLGLAELNPVVEVPKAIFNGSKIQSPMVANDDSPDVPVTTESAQQSENSIFVDPNDNATALNSNNSGPPGFYGADALYTFDSGETFQGQIQGAGGGNSGDPTTAIGTDGRWYVGFINTGGGQSISYSDDQGDNWTQVFVAANPGQLADKNHMWIDNKEGSPYENYLYDAWTDFGGPNQGNIVLSRSSDNGESWSAITNISSGTSGFHQGVNLSTGPNGEVYAVWAVYYGGGDEKAIGFTKSTDGGETWETATTIITNIRGIRSSGVPQNMRVNSFPTMAVDNGDGANSGNIYVTWTNVGEPGVNTGSDRNMIRSEDGGATWSDPIRVNQDDEGVGNANYFGWIACDASNGMLSVVFYTNRDIEPQQAQTWVALSSDAGNTWEDFQVSDVTFTPSPIPGLASGYFGDYIGITALNGTVYPCWTDNRSGSAKTYVSAFQTINILPPTTLQAAVDQETGVCDLTWEFDFEGANGFQYFKVYRNDEYIGDSDTTYFSDTLEFYDYYTYDVTAFYGGTAESSPAEVETQYGSSTIEITPDTLETVVYVNDSAFQNITIKNTGVLNLDFSLSPFLFNRSDATYETASGGGDEFIHGVRIGDFYNTSGDDNYMDFTTMYASLKTGQSYPVEVEVKRPYTGDQCAIWVDYNQNGVFDEPAVILIPNEDNSLFTGTLTPPKGSMQGSTRMRVRLAGPGETLSATGDTPHGEVEDYTVLLADWLSLNPDSGTIEPGDSIISIVKFDATDLETGTYQETIKFTTNDLEHPVYNVDVTMNVTDLQITASASPELICQGDETQLSVTPVGGTGSYVFNWTSVPEGFSSGEQNPVATPDVTTTYIVSVNDGIVILTDTVVVTVNPSPVVDLGDDQLLCGIAEYELDAGNPGDQYLWSTGETTQTITATGSGPTDFWVTVTNDSGCSASDTIVLNFAPLPVVDLGPDTVICHNGEITLDAGEDGTEYLWSTGETTRMITVYGEDYSIGEQEFSCLVTNAAGCQNSDTLTIDVKDCSGIGEENASIGIKIFPNPNKGVFNLKIESQNSQTISLKIISVTGRVVYNLENIEINGTLTQQVDLSQMANGVYSLFIVGDHYVTNRKIVLNR